MKSDQLCTLIISYGDSADNSKQITTAHTFYGTDPNEYPQTRRLIHNASLLPCITQSATDADLTVVRKFKQPTDHLNVKTITNYKSTRSEDGVVKRIDKKNPDMNVHEVTVKYEGYYPNYNKNYVNVIHDNVKSHEIKDTDSSKYKQISKTTFDYTSTPSELVITPPIPKSSPPRDDIIKPKIIHSSFDDGKKKDDKQKVRKDLDYVNTSKVTHFGVYDDTYSKNQYSKSYESLSEYYRSKSSPPPISKENKAFGSKSTKHSTQYDLSDKSISPIMSTYEQIEMAKKIQQEMQTWKFRNGKPVVKESNIDEDDSVSGKSGGRYGLDTREVSYIDSAYESAKGDYQTPNLVMSPKVVTTFEATPAYAIMDDDSVKSYNTYKSVQTPGKPYSSTQQLRTHETIISETIETEHRIIKNIKPKKDDKVYAEPAIVKGLEGSNQNQCDSISQVKQFKDNISVKSPSSRNIYQETYSAMSSSSRIKDSSSKKFSPYDVTNIVKTSSPKPTKPIIDSSESYTSTYMSRTIKTSKPSEKIIEPIKKSSESVVTKEIHITKPTKYSDKQKTKSDATIIVKEPQMIKTKISHKIPSQKRENVREVIRSVVVEEYTNEEITRYSREKKLPRHFEDIKSPDELLKRSHEIQPIPLIKKPKEVKKTFDDKCKIKEITIQSKDIEERNRSKLIEPSPIIPIPKIPRITQTEPIEKEETAPPKPKRKEETTCTTFTKTITQITGDTSTTTQIESKKPSATIKIPSPQIKDDKEIKKPINIIKSVTKDEGTNTEEIIDQPRPRSPSPPWRYETDEIIDTTKIIEDQKKTKSVSTETQIISSESKDKVKKALDKLVDNMYNKQISKSNISEEKTSSHSEFRGSHSEKWSKETYSSNTPIYNNNNIFSSSRDKLSHQGNFTETSYKHPSNNTNASSDMHTSTYKSAISPRVGIDSIKSSGTSSTGFSKVFVETCKYSAGMSSMSQSAANRIRDDREREKKEMSILNDRLASYIEKVRFLEAQNRKLKADLDLLRSRVGKESYSIKEMYEKEIYEARQLFSTTNREREDLEKAINELLEEIRLFRDKYDNAKYCRDTDRDKINKLIEQLCKLEAETQAMRKQIENMNDDVIYLKKQNASLLQELQKTRNEVDQETLNKIDYQNQVQTLLEEIRFITEANEQEIIDLQNMAYRDTTTENREYFKQELVSAIKDIREEYDQICEAQRTEMESWYRIKVQEIHTKCATKEMEQSYCKEEVRKLRSQCIDIRGRLSELESRNAILEKQAEELRYQMSDEARSYEAQIADRDSQINKMKKEADALMIELQLLLDKKTTLDAEIAIYKSLLDGEANRVGLSQLTDRVRGYTFSNETLINQKRIVKGEQTSRSGFQKSAKGNVSIIEANLDGKVITLENSNRSKAENIGGWKIKRFVGGSHPKEITYTFPKDFILKPLKTVKVYARNEGVHNPPESIVTSEESFGSGVHVQTFLYNADGEERATFMQKSNVPF